VRCVPGVTATIRVSRRDPRRTSAHATTSSKPTSRAIVTEWVGAGAICGLWLGAAFGLVVGIFPNPLVVVFTIPIGGVIGLVSGVAAGVMNGIGLACLFGLGSLGQTRSSRRLRAALAAGLVSGVVSFVIFDWALGANTTRWLTEYLPTAVATFVGVALSQRLEPNRSDAEQ
jgi:hypothetical protein